MEPFTFRSDDVGRFESFLSQNYSPTRIRANGAGLWLSVTRRVFGPQVGFDSFAYDFDVGYDAAPHDKLMVCCPTSSRMRCTSDGADEFYGPGDAFLVAIPDFPYSGVARAGRFEFAVLDPDLLARAVGLHRDVDGGQSLRMLTHRPRGRAAAVHVRQLIGHLRDETMGSPALVDAPLVVASAARYLAVAVVHAFLKADPVETAPRLDSHPQGVRRAVAFIESHPALDLTVADIAAAAHLSVRTLQLAFRRHLETTPMAYLRRVRLACAHQDLLAADPTRTTVAAIAGHWGFANSGRFATAYRALYHHTPAHTLHRG